MQMYLRTQMSMPSPLWSEFNHADVSVDADVCARSPMVRILSCRCSSGRRCLSLAHLWSMFDHTDAVVDADV